MAKKSEINYIWTDKKRTFLGLPISFTRYFLTEKKFISRVGFLSITEEEIDLYKITDKKLTLSLGQRIFGCGSITIYSRDTDTPSTLIKSIKNPRKVLELLDKNIEIQRDKYRTRGRDLIGNDYFDNDDDDDNT
ncbi:MAG: PH domain-containing protein [Ruminococcus sp.]|nr:PH domain-containing protein [Oscillospiraceae bacterium]MDY4413899.1 PH domain-containing protein [Ruminococcus sp.]